MTENELRLNRRSHPSLLVLVRHVESMRNALKQGKLEMPETAEARELARLHDYQIPLSPLGERQAATVGAFLRARGLAFDKCYDSGYQRAKETRRIALEAAYSSEIIAAMSVRSELLLREREPGILHNLTAADIAANPLLSRWVEEFRRNPFQTKYLGGESLAEVVDRVRHFRDWMSDRRVSASSSFATTSSSRRSKSSCPTTTSSRRSNWRRLRRRRTAACMFTSAARQGGVLRSTRRRLDSVDDVHVGCGCCGGKKYKKCCCR